jgi:hypothetical protein
MPIWNPVSEYKPCILPEADSEKKVWTLKRYLFIWKVGFSGQKADFSHETFFNRFDKINLHNSTTFKCILYLCFNVQWMALLNEFQFSNNDMNQTMSFIENKKHYFLQRFFTKLFFNKFMQLIQYTSFRLVSHFKFLNKSFLLNGHLEEAKLFTLQRRDFHKNTSVNIQDK